MGLQASLSQVTQSSVMLGQYQQWRNKDKEKEKTSFLLVFIRSIFEQHAEASKDRSRSNLSICFELFFNFAAFRIIAKCD